ncbi:hypothetical protein C9I47_0697 [Lysobacter maris]|uniref:Glycosyltransferase 2-like domain-containing protein n=1 Tax=Marilutibacter maris TaxID=1605891 RepID=A0A2U9T7D8_9GAMM|nr:hypothetical protein C9I47_0697 [Lysobacter maris]
MSGATACAYADYLLRVRSDVPSDYQNWVRRFDTLSADGMEALLRREAGFGARRPLISILLPTYQTPERWLRRCIESVQRQIYQDWQLCIADDASPDPTVMKIIAEYASSDKRIRYVRREANGHISETSNSALALAQGDWIALLDHDDELRPHALLEIAARIRDQPGAKMVYSDEDKMDLEGRRFDPYFKPDFDIDLLRGQNYICHFTAIRRELALEVGGFRSGFEGSQDHDLFLRCVERLSPVEVAHIPKVLYHWRAIPGSTALSRDAKDYAGDAGARAVEDHLLRTGAGASVEQLSHGHYRVRWPIPEPAPLVSLVVPTRDRVELLRVCVESILERTSYRNFELVVVDNGSTDPESLAYLASLTAANRAKVLRYDEPFNYSRINNWAVQQARGEILALINNDIEVISPDWLGEMVSHAIRPGVGAVGAMLYYPDETIQHAGVILGIDGVAAHIYSGMPRGYPGHGGRARVVQGMSAVTAACMVVSRAAYEAVGGLDEGLEVAFNDIDFCLRLGQAGYRNVWTPFAEMYHHESASRGHEDTAEKKARFAGEVELMRSRWAAILQEDPAYNVNLSLKSRYFDLAIPPRVPMWEAAPD